MIFIILKFLKTLKPLLRKRGFIVFTIFLLTVLFFTYLFSTIEHTDYFTSLYWTIITMATIGYGDVVPNTYTGKILAMIVAFTGIAIYTLFISLLAERVASINIKKFLGLLSVNLKNHIILVGWNETSKEAIRELKIGKPESKIVVIVPHDVREPLLSDLHVIVGDVLSEETLRRASVDHASHVIITLDDDSKTVLLTLLIRKLNRNVKIIAEALSFKNVDFIKSAGADKVILSKGLCGRLIASAVFEPSVVDFIEDVTTSTYGNDVVETQIREVIGETVSEALSIVKEKYDAIMIGLVRNGKVIINPQANLKIREDDKILIIEKTRRHSYRD